MDAESAASASRLAGLITLATGVGLTFAPGRVGRLVGLDDPRTARLIGIGDLSLAPGLVAGKPRWPWMSARAALNLPMAAVFLSSPHRSARATGVALLVLTVNDVAYGADAPPRRTLSQPTVAAAASRSRTACSARS